MNTGHWAADARGILQLFEMFFAYLEEYLYEGIAGRPIQWGDETRRLAPAGIVAGALAIGHSPASLFADSSAGATKDSSPETGPTEEPNGKKHDLASAIEQAVGP